MEVQDLEEVYQGIAREYLSVGFRREGRSKLVLISSDFERFEPAARWIGRYFADRRLSADISFVERNGSVRVDVGGDAYAFDLDYFSAPGRVISAS